MSRGAKVGNWNRWGESDERGAANLLTPAAVIAAAASVRTGEVVSLGLALDASTLVPPGRRALEHAMTRDGGDYAIGGKVLGRSRYSDDLLIIGTHTGTHVDALAHVWYDEELYNGFGQDSVRSSGARRCGIDKLGPLVGRGVLLDVAGLVDDESLPIDFRVDGDVLESACAASEVTVGAGDIVLIRTGWLGRNGDDETAYFEGEPGLDEGGAYWLADRDVAAIGADNYAVEQLAPGARSGFPVHEILLRDHGIPLLEGVVLDELAARDVHEFLFVAAPLQVRGGTASPVCPVAIL